MITKTEQNFLMAYDEHAQSIIRHVYFKVSNLDTAKDITQETFCKAWKFITSTSDNYQNNKVRNIKTFLYTIANNLIIDHYRKKDFTPLSLDMVQEKDMSVEAEQEKFSEYALNRAFIEKRLLELPKEYKEIIMYRYVDDLSIKEISDLTGKTGSNVKVIIHRSIKILRNNI